MRAIVCYGRFRLPCPDHSGISLVKMERFLPLKALSNVVKNGKHRRAPEIAFARTLSWSACGGDGILHQVHPMALPSKPRTRRLKRNDLVSELVMCPRCG